MLDFKSAGIKTVCPNGKRVRKQTVRYGQHPPRTTASSSSRCTSQVKKVKKVIAKTKSSLASSASATKRAKKQLR
eukprot:287031-Hanusia_phi.AAC.1